MNNCIILIAMGVNYKIYIPYFILSLYFTNNICDILILTDNNNISNFEETFHYVKSLYENKTKKKIKFIDNIYYDNLLDIYFPTDNEYTKLHKCKLSKPKYFRWLMDPKIYEKYDYVYIGDIDLLICEDNIFEKHIAYLTNNNITFSNHHRSFDSNTNRLTGLHFFKVKEYLDRYREKIINYSQKDYDFILDNTLKLYKIVNKRIYYENEIILYSLVDKEELKRINYHAGKESSTPIRDFHGIHIGCLRHYNKININKKSDEILQLINTHNIGDIEHYIYNLKKLLNTSEFRFIHSLLDDKIVNLIYQVYNTKHNIKIISQDQPTNGGFGTVAYTLNNTLVNSKLNSTVYYFNIACKNSNEENVKYVNICNFNEIITQILKKEKINIDYEKLNLNIDNNDIIITCTPIMMYIINDLKESLKKDFKHFYCCGSLPINFNFYKNSNFFNLIENTSNINSILNSNRVLNNTMKNNSKYSIIPNSSLLENLCNKIKETEKSNVIIHRSLDGQLTDFKYIFDNKKKYDLIFVCSNIIREVKNFDLILKIYLKFPHLNKVIIGKNSNKYKYLENTLVFESLSNELVNKYLSESKISLCPSFIDAGPSTVMESILNKAIPLCSFNCGFSRLLPQFSMSPYDENIWYQKIDKILKSYSKDQTKYYNILNLVKYKVITNKIDFLRIITKK